MRINMPVTNIERHLKDGEYIVSKTDLKGQITYVNSPFMEISGFTEDELLGHAHNIVRHLDIVSRHGGRIEVQSEVGCGTTFCVRLPIKQAQVEKT